MSIITSLKAWAQALKRQTLVVYFAARDPRTPWPARLVAMLVAAYALSPIDLIPDFVPVLGYLDDLLLVPLGLALAVRLIPHCVLPDARRRASSAMSRPISRRMAVAIAVVWVAVVAWAAAWAWRAFAP